MSRKNAAAKSDAIRISAQTQEPAPPEEISGRVACRNRQNTLNRTKQQIANGCSGRKTCAAGTSAEKTGTPTESARKTPRNGIRSSGTQKKYAELRQKRQEDHNMKKQRIIPLALLLILSLTFSPLCTAASLPGALCVTDTVPADTGADLADALQALIDANPNRTLYFPDGEYLVSHSLRTPADPSKSVDLQLANYAVIKATDDFEGGAVIRLGGKDPYNTTAKAGSNYGLFGGVIDGNGIADGVSIDSGRETKVQNTAIKHTVVGLRIGFGANSGSSDADIRDINIIGNNTAEAVGMLIEGFDNTFTNIRIGCVYQGVIMRSAGNSLTNIHPLFQIGWDNYDGSCGFVEESNNNLYTYCYSDQFQTGFKIIGNGRSIYDNCFAYWWSGAGGNCTGFKVEGDSFNSIVTNLRIDFREDTDNTVYDGPVKGSGVFERLLINERNINADRSYKLFMKTNPIFQLKELLSRFKAFFSFIAALFRR